jgi:hypothetical protein
MDWSAAMLDNQSTATINNANILVIGDSYAPLYGYPIKEIGGLKYGYGGGYEFFASNIYNTYGFYCALGSGWVETTYEDADNWNDRAMTTKTSGATIKLSSVNFNKFKIHYKTKSGYGRFSVQLNSLTPDTIDCDAAEGAGWYTWNKAGNNIYTYYGDTVYIRALDSDTVKLFGHSLEMHPKTYAGDQKKGYLNVHISQNGGSAILERFTNKDTAEIHQFLDSTDASLAILTFLDESTYSPIISMDSLVGLLQLLRPEMDVMIVCPNDESNHRGQAQSDSLLIIARDRGASFMNALSIGTYDDFVSSGAMIDGIHLSQIGKYLTFWEFEKALFTEKQHNYNLTAWKLTNRGDYMIFPRSQNIAIVSRDAGYIDPTLNNTLLGYRSTAFVKPTGYGATFIGALAGEKSTANYNTAIGLQSMAAITSGAENTAIGALSLINGTTTTSSVAIGYNALRTTTTGATQNVAIGHSALYTNGDADGNTAIGYQAGYSNTTGAYGVFVGRNSGYGMTTGNYATFVGAASGQSNTTGNQNTGIGYGALLNNTTGSNNTAVGYNCFGTMSGAGQNTGIGRDAGASVTNGENNTYLGYRAGYSNQTGGTNVAIGRNAGYLHTGSGSIFIGYEAGYNETGSNKLYIDNSNTTKPLIGGDFSANTVTIGGELTHENTIAELFENASNVTATTSTYKTIVSLQAGTNVNATYTDSTITVGQAGTYLINYSASFTHSVNNTTCHISLFVDDVEDTQMDAERKVATGGVYGQVSATNIAVLSASDVLKLKAKSDNSGNLTIQYLNFNATRIQ